MKMFQPKNVEPETVRLMMCAPQHFEVSYSINPWMDPKTWERRSSWYLAQARQQWASYVEVLMQVGADVMLIPSVAGLPDMTFTANAGFVLDNRVVVSRFRHPERQGETAHFDTFFRRLAAQGLVGDILHMPEGIFFEGAGDALWDPSRDIIWTGHGQRSDSAAADALAKIYNKRVVSLELVDQRFYHLDTCLRPLANGHILYYPGAFSDEGRRQIEAVAGKQYLIPVSTTDACAFAVNAVTVGHHVILSSASPALRRRLLSRGYTVHRSPLWAFHRSGGSALCLTLTMTNRSHMSRTGTAEPQPLRRSA